MDMLRHLLTRARDELETVPQTFARTALLLVIDEALTSSVDDDAEGALTAGREALEASVADYNAMVALYEAACARNGGLEAQVAKYQDDVDEARKAAIAAETERDRLGHELVEAAELLTKRREERDDAVSRRDMYRDAHVRMVQALSECQDERDAARGEVERLRAEVASLSAELDACPGEGLVTVPKPFAARAALQPAPVQAAAPAAVCGLCVSEMDKSGDRAHWADDNAPCSRCGRATRGRVDAHPAATPDPQAAEPKGTP